MWENPLELDEGQKEVALGISATGSTANLLREERNEGNEEEKFISFPRFHVEVKCVWQIPSFDILWREEDEEKGDVRSPCK